MTKKDRNDVIKGLEKEIKTQMLVILDSIKCDTMTEEQLHYFINGVMHGMNLCIDILKEEKSIIMTREEQIEKFADSETMLCKKVSNDYGEALKEGIIIGAKWADEHPKKGLVNFEDACKWLRANIDLYANTRRSLFSNYQEVYLTDNFETEFRKAMEE